MRLPLWSHDRVAKTATLSLENPKVTAIALSLPHAQLERVTQAGNGRCLFHVGNLPEDFLDRLRGGEITVNGRDVVSNLERILKVIEENRQRGRWR